jgi:hypothetical protein
MSSVLSGGPVQCRLSTPDQPDAIVADDVEFVVLNECDARIRGRDRKVYSRNEAVDSCLERRDPVGVVEAVDVVKLSSSEFRPPHRLCQRKSH